MSTAFSDVSHPVIACVDGGDHGDRALRYAIREAARRGTGLRLVHVPMEFIPYAPLAPGVPMPDLREIGSAILKDALDRCYELAPDLYVEGALLSGTRVHAIVEESAEAACVVVGTRNWRSHRRFGGSTTTGVAARSSCPVIAVPPVWVSESPGTRVIVAVDSDSGPDVVLEHGFEAARLSGAELTILHAWMAPEPYESRFDTWHADSWREAAAASLHVQTAGIRAAYPDVVTREVATYGTAGDAIADLTTGVDLLVVGRHRGDHPHFPRLGSIASHALHSGRCPLEIVPVPEPPESGAPR
jgi:nucleotide-binding universal stress UspA family protein